MNSEANEFLTSVNFTRSEAGQAQCTGFDVQEQQRSGVRGVGNLGAGMGLFLSIPTAAELSGRSTLAETVLRVHAALNPESALVGPPTLS